MTCSLPFHGFHPSFLGYLSASVKNRLKKTRETPENKLSLAAHEIGQSEVFWNNRFGSIVSKRSLCVPLEGTTWAKSDF